MQQRTSNARHCYIRRSDAFVRYIGRSDAHLCNIRPPASAAYRLSEALRKCWSTLNKYDYTLHFITLYYSTCLTYSLVCSYTYRGICLATWNCSHNWSSIVAAIPASGSCHSSSVEASRSCHHSGKTASGCCHSSVASPSIFQLQPFLEWC